MRNIAAPARMVAPDAPASAWRSRGRGGGAASRRAGRLGLVERGFRHSQNAWFLPAYLGTPILFLPVVHAATRMRKKMALLVLALLLGTTASPTPTLLRVLPSYGRAERALFGVNWEGVVKGTSWLNVTATGIHGVPDWVSQQQPLLSPKLLYGLRTLRVRSLRYPGGAPSNYFNWSNSSFVPPERCNDHPGPGGCAIYWPTQVAANQYFPRHALGWSSFAALLEAVNATGVWCLDIVNSSPHETLQALLALQDAGSADRRLEIGETSSF